MSALVVESPLAARIRAIAEHEGRPIEAVLASMIDQYYPAFSVDELNARLRAADYGITPPIGHYDGPTLTPAEEQALLEHTSAGDRSGAEMVRDERQQGW